MATLDTLSADDLRAVISGYAEALAAHRAGINRLNVYPVPDGDTGTNMALTLQSVAEELDTAGTDLASVCKAISHGSLMGARGNSGVILSQILRGMVDVMRSAGDGSGDGPGDGSGAIDGPVVARALVAASEAAYSAVMRPVEGTILTVIRASSTGAAGALETEPELPLVGVLEAAKASGADALARTPELLPVLAEAGVVDAGGTGLLLLIDVLLHVVDGRAVPEAVEGEGIFDAALADAVTQVHTVGGDAGSHGGGGTIADLRYEVMYFLEADDSTIPAFKDVWAGIGDSIVVVGGDGLWNCHIHTDGIGAAVEAAIDAGRPRDIRVTDLLDQVEEERWVREAGIVDPPESNEPVETAVVAVATGEGIRRIFHSLGVQRIVTGGQTMNPSTAQLLEAVESAPADQVVILPNNKNIIPVAEQLDAETTKTVYVVPTRGVAEGFASLLAYDPEASGLDNAKAMIEAAASVVAGEVTRAVRDSTCELGPITEGDYLGIARDGIRSLGSGLDLVCTQLLDLLVTDEHEIVTIIEGEGSSPAITRHVTQWLEDHHPDVTSEIHHGGQPLYPYLFGIE
ncbi:MAG: DAK2 domain-containing protein [Acidimicrobiales bacterium]